MKNKTMSLGRGRINNIYRVRSPGDKNLVVPLTGVCVEARWEMQGWFFLELPMRLWSNILVEV